MEFIVNEASKEELAQKIIELQQNGFKKMAELLIEILEERYGK